MRILICEDSALLREGLVRLLADAGHEVVAALPDATRLDDTVVEVSPDLCILDVRLPPTRTDEGIRAALRLRAADPQLPVLVLSQYVEERYASDLIAGKGGALGYLLKDRVADVGEFVESVERIGAGSVEKHITAVFQKLELEQAESGNRRVLAVLAHLEHGGPVTGATQTGEPS